MIISRILAALAGVATLFSAASVQAGTEECPVEMQVYKFSPTGKRLTPDFKPSGRPAAFIKIDGIDGESTDDIRDLIDELDLEPVPGGEGVNAVFKFVRITDAVSSEQFRKHFEEPPMLYSAEVSCRK